ncbi:MAG: nucleotide sugar dehydrogenase [Tannerellaceae bacterium]|jgi:UDP-N-acetyl-D-galactosamine dehydrogenase|nr:nucleotide sugar dehydrogenase [Tannerellaceae bacterium]
MTEQPVKIAVLGLGYVGLPLARLFSSVYATIGFDLDEARVKAINSGLDITGEVESSALLQAIADGFICTTNMEDLRSCNTYIVAVPTPVDCNNTPDLSPLLSASRTIGEVISRGDTVIYESTVYPGVTEDECVPVIESISGLKLNVDFFAGYSPERINPGDREHPIESITKVVSGSCPEAADKVERLYNSVLKNGVCRVSSIRAAEASKIMENTQRDVNIAFMNEQAKIFNAMGIDTQEVIRAASTKWNFLRFAPGLVGGHCISVDPYYLIQKAQVYGIYPRIMSAARRLNDGMGEYVGQQVVKLMNKKGILIKDARILILGFTFKENCPDIRNTKVIDIYATLREYTSGIVIHDPCADATDAGRKYGIEITGSLPQGQFDAIILAVAHEAYADVNIKSLRAPLSIVYDVKSFLPSEEVDGRL